MKNTLLVIVALLVGGCGKGKEAQTKTKVTEGNNTKPIKVDDNATKPIKADDTNATKLTAEEQEAVGEYEFKKDGATVKFVFLENGNVEGYTNGKKVIESKWEVSKDGELHLEENGGILVLRINKDGSITDIALIGKDGERDDLPKEFQLTIKKIK